MPGKFKPQREILKEYFDLDRLPHLWCPGCGIGTGLGCLIRAADAAGVPRDDLCIVTGIGCSGLTYNYTRLQAVHGPHGRALTIATGLKVANPRLKVVVPMGDGDCAAIGGNHLLHAAKRNIDVVAVVFNNSNYGMTGGQFSPTTPLGARTSTTPYGHIEKPLDIAGVAMAAGATYVARCTTYHVRQLIRLLKGAFEHKGFSLVEVMTQCPQIFGRLNKWSSPVQMLLDFKERAIPIQGAAKLTPAELEQRIPIGVLVQREAPEFTETVWELTREVEKRQVGSG